MPGQFESILDKLQRKLGKQTIRKASSIARPKPRPDVIQMQAINDFMKRNPRAGGGLLNGSSEEAAAAAFRKKVDELMDDGYDFGEAVREAMRQGYKDGGMLVKPSADRSRPGYSGDAIKLPDSPDVGTKALGGGVYEVTSKKGFKTYYGKVRGKKKSFGKNKKAAENFVKEELAKPDTRKLKKSVIDIQSEGGTLLEKPKYKNTLARAMNEVNALQEKGYGNVDKIVKKYQKLFTKKVGSKTKTGKTITTGVGSTEYKAITFAIREQANKLGIQSIKNENVIKALDDYSKIKNPQRGDIPKILKKHKVSQGSFNRYLQENKLNLRKKIPLKFDSESIKKSYYAKLRRQAINEFSSSKFEKFLQGVPKIQKSHMGDLYNKFVTTGNIGFAPALINQEALKLIDDNIKAINEETANLFKNKPKGYIKKIDALNQLGDDLAAASQGYKKYQGIDPITGKDLKIISFSKPSQELDPTELLGKDRKLSSLTIADKPTLEMLKKDAMRAAKLPKKEIVPLKEKILSTTGKVLKGAGKVLKPLGYAIGTNAVIQANSMANEMGIQLSKIDQLMALDSGDPNVAIDNYKRRNIPGYSEEQAGITLGKFQDDFTEVGDESFTSYFDGGIVSVLKGVK